MSQDRGNSKGWRNNNHSHHQHKKPINVGDKGREVLENMNENSPVIKQFQQYAIELDEKHDRYERLVKHGRDLTIESKRIIFFLHTIDRESKKNIVLQKAEERLNGLIKVLIKVIAIELDKQDSYQYLRAYKAGLQEFVEAMSFFWYLQYNTIYNWTKLQESFTYKHVSSDETQKTIQTLIPPSDFILGIADLTGELMRKCINNLASGDIASCYQTCNFVRCMYQGFLGCIGIARKEVSKKFCTLRQNLIKMENVCYAIKVRGSEIPKHMLADVATIASEDINVYDDEGYQVY